MDTLLHGLISSQIRVLGLSFMWCATMLAFLKPVYGKERCEEKALVKNE